MPNISAARVVVEPSYWMPEILLPYQQASGAFELLPTGEPLTRLSDGDLYAYIPRADIRTKLASGQSPANELPSVSVVMSYMSTPTYLQRVRAEYDHHDTAAMGRWNVNIVEAQRLGMRQGHFQLLRSNLLYGLNPQNGEGLINTNGATSINLPSDPFGNNTVVTYDNGAMAFFLLSVLSAIKSRTNQLGIGRKFTILGPQRVLSVFEYQGIVQLTQFQRQGGGVASVAGTVKDVAKWNDDEIIWAYDDTLIGKGNGGNDAVMVVMPEVEKPNGGKINTNEFAKLSPGLDACTLQLCDMVAPREITAPLAGGAVDIVSELRCTSGWGVRPEAIEIISLQYQ